MERKLCKTIRKSAIRELQKANYKIPDGFNSFVEYINSIILMGIYRGKHKNRLNIYVCNALTIYTRGTEVIYIKVGRQNAIIAPFILEKYGKEEKIDG